MKEIGKNSVKLGKTRYNSEMMENTREGRGSKAPAAFRGTRLFFFLFFLVVQFHSCFLWCVVVVFFCLKKIKRIFFPIFDSIYKTGNAAARPVDRR